MSSNNKGQGQSANQMGKDDASRIQSTQDKSGGDMTSGGFAARAQGAGDRNSNAGANANAGGNAQSGGAKK